MRVWPWRSKRTWCDPREQRRQIQTVASRAFTLGGPTWETTQAPTASRVSSPRGFTGGHRWRRDAGQPWLVRDQPGQDQPLCRCNIDVDVGRIRQLLLRIAADIEELEGTTSAAGRRSASGGERMLFRAWDGETRP